MDFDVKYGGNAWTPRLHLSVPNTIRTEQIGVSLNVREAQELIEQLTAGLASLCVSLTPKPGGQSEWVTGYCAAATATATAPVEST